MSNGVQVADQPRDKWAEAVVVGISRDDRMEQLRNLLGSHEAAERFKTVALHAIVHDNALRECDPMSVIEAVREAAVLGLEPTGVLGEAWILPYRNIARLQVGYRGYLKLIRQSDKVPFLDAQLVYMNDHFDLDLGTSPKVEHRPLLYGERDPETNELLADRGNYRGAYAWAQLEGAYHPLIEWMTIADIEQVRKASPSVRAGRRSPWDDWYGEMARIRPIRRLAKRLPLSTQAARALAYEEESDKVEQAVYQQPANVQLPAKQAALSALAERFPEQAPEPATAPQEPTADMQPTEEVSSSPAPEQPATEPVQGRIEDEKGDDDLEELIQRMELGGESG